MTRAVRRLRSLLGFAKRARSVEEFERMFRQFRDVLDSNNRALEIITQMGDVLGGEYLFDTQYVKRARDDLSSAVGRSLGVFDELTRGRYRKLPGVVSAIDARIGRVVDEAPSPSHDLVLFHEDVTPDRAAAVGGKNANIALLRNAAKLEVPDGFAITTAAFDSFIRHNGIGEKIQRHRAEGRRSPEELREIVLRGEVPPDLDRELGKAIRKLRSRCGPGCTVAVRSSAEDEDGEHSFAGQFETILNVPLRRAAVEDAYREVIASLFSLKAAAYQERLGYALGSTRMAVACMAMVDAAVSGVLYTSNPVGPADTMVIDSSWGLGTSVVDGRTDADHLVVRKDGTGALVDEKVGRKQVKTVPLGETGTEERETTEEERGKRSLDPAQLARLLAVGSLVERYFRSPQDVEWAIDRQGTILVLQSRPLRMQGAAETGRPAVELPAAERIAFAERGTVVQEGVAAGRVHILRSMKELDSVPRGAVLVTRHDSSDVVRAMPVIAAIVTDTGAATSHMASLSREFRVPTLVNTGNATKVLEDGQAVTVVAAREGAAVYPGLVATSFASEGSARMEDLHEFRKRRYVLRLIAPLNLVDPMRDEFTPEACRTVHDVLRFIHEKSVASLIEGAGMGARSPRAVKLDLSVPAGIVVIDIGGGLANPEGKEHVTLEEITSVPFKALAGGMTHPGVWRSEAVPLTTGDFMSSMFRAPDIVSASAGSTRRNVAVISREYANVNVEFGYHYAIVDCYCSDTARNNHVNMRFAGGATDITKRSRRLQFLALVLEKHGFNMGVKGDLIMARLSNVRREDMIEILDQLGKLLGFTRQLDAVLHDDSDVERFARRFTRGTYELG